MVRIAARRKLSALRARASEFCDYLLLERDHRRELELARVLVAGRDDRAEVAGRDEIKEVEPGVRPGMVRRLTIAFGVALVLSVVAAGAVTATEVQKKATIDRTVPDTETVEETITVEVVEHVRTVQLAWIDAQADKTSVQVVQKLWISFINEEPLEPAG